MSKCIYTESEITQSGAQLIICSIALSGLTDKTEEKKFKRSFADSWNAAKQMLDCNVDDENYEEVRVGDVIWTETGGGKHIGFCVVRENDKDGVNKEAVRLCVSSAKTKARSLKNKYVGMDLFASDTPQQWADIVDIVEDNLEEIQGVVCIPTNDALIKVMENLPGSNDFRMFEINKT